MDSKKVKRLVVIFAVFWTLFGNVLYDLEILGRFADRDLFECISILFIGVLVSFHIKAKVKYVWLILLVFNCVEQILPFVHNQNIYYLCAIIVGLYYLITKYNIYEIYYKRGKALFKLDT